VRVGSQYPTFLGIGAQKAGTTWLYHNLRAHPGVWLPPEKELHYFDEKRAARGSILARVVRQTPEAARWRRQFSRHARRAVRTASIAELRWLMRYFFGAWDDAWYASLFARAGGCTTGEVTPSYAILGSDHVAQVRHVIPDARIVLLMRNPIERAWSHAMMEVRNRSASDSDIPRLLRHFEGEGSRLRTDYMRTIEIWGEHYPAEQIFLGFFEDVHFHPEALLGRVCEFIGITPLERWPDATSRVYGSSVVSIPGELAIALAELYQDPTRELASRFGGYASWWHYCAEWLVENRPEAGVPTPLYTSPVWSAWLAGRDSQIPIPQLQSAPLSRIALAARAS
jgi:Sulfotransferase family